MSTISPSFFPLPVTSGNLFVKPSAPRIFLPCALEVAPTLDRRAPRPGCFVFTLSIVDGVGLPSPPSPCVSAAPFSDPHPRCRLFAEHVAQFKTRAIDTCGLPPPSPHGFFPPPRFHPQPGGVLDCLANPEFRRASVMRLQFKSSPAAPFVFPLSAHTEASHLRHSVVMQLSLALRANSGPDLFPLHLFPNLDPIRTSH